MAGAKNTPKTFKGAGEAHSLFESGGREEALRRAGNQLARELAYKLVRPL